MQVLVCFRRLGPDLADARRLAGLCASGQCDAASHDLARLVASQRAAIACSRAELDVLDRQLAQLEAALTGEQPEPDLCLKGGDNDGEMRRPELSGSAASVPGPGRGNVPRSASSPGMWVMTITLSPCGTTSSSSVRSP